MFNFLTIDDLGNLPPPKWLIDGLFEQDALVMLVGPPGSFKSFLAIDWALSLAAGLPWNGRATEPSRVLYALGEGKASLLKRINAWADHAKLDREGKAKMKANFRVTFDVPQLSVPRSFADFANALAEDQFNPTLLVIDTYARSMVGKNENDPLDTGIWVEHADQLRKKGMTVLLLHHTKKNVEFGLQYRGSTALFGALDTSFILERNPEGLKGYAKLFCNKQKDHQEPEDIWMQHKQIRPNPNEEGSIVLCAVDPPGEAESEAREANEAALQEIIESLIQSDAFDSDRARARELSEKYGIATSAAQSRIHRARKKQHNREQMEMDFVE